MSRILNTMRGIPVATVLPHTRMWRISALATGRAYDIATDAHATGRAYDIATDAHADIWFDLGNAARVLGNTDFCKWMEFKVIPT